MNTTVLSDHPLPVSGDFYDLHGVSVCNCTPLSLDDSRYCVIRSFIPPGACVPLHDHEQETFCILEGELAIYCEDRWHISRAGQVFDVPPRTPHGWRNDSGRVVEALVIVPMRLGRFLRALAESGLERLPRLAADYGYWLGSPEENARAGFAGQTDPDLTTPAKTPSSAHSLATTARASGMSAGAARPRAGRQFEPYRPGSRLLS